MYNIPSKINSFNVYKDGTRLVGISGEVTLPDFESLTETLDGPGLLGEIDDPTLGHFKGMEMEVPFRTMDRQMFALCKDSSGVNLTLRGSIQCTINEDMGTSFRPMRVVLRGKNKGITGGKVKQGSGTASSIKLEILYILIEIDREAQVELDKLNCVYKVRGKDLLKKVRKMC